MIIGDGPGVLRIVAGTPETPGDSLTSRATESLLNTPLGLAIAGDGTLYIADRGNARVLAVASSGALDVVIDHRDRREEPRLRTPEGLALDGAGGLLITDPGSHSVWRLEIANGALELVAGTGARGAAPDTAIAIEADLNEPAGIAIAPDGRIYFSERAGQRLSRIDADGILVRIAGTGLPGPGGDGGAAREAELDAPLGLALFGSTLYVADSGNERVRAIDLQTGVIITVAGAGVAGFGGDGGPATDALLDTPAAVAVAGGGRILFVSDSGNHRVRFVNLQTGEIATFAGNGETDYNGDLQPAGATAIEAPTGLATSTFQLLFVSASGDHIVLRTPVGLITDV